MTQRWLAPSGVEVRSNDLNYETSAISKEILQRLVDTSVPGVASGLDVTVTGGSGNSTTLDIASGRGYAPNGELIEVPTAINAVALHDYTNSLPSLITLIYTEQDAVPRSHETNGTAPNTQAQRSYRVAVYTQAQFSALPATTADVNGDLSQDTQDRALVVAVVIPLGSGVNLTTDTIQSAAGLLQQTAAPVFITYAGGATLPGVELLGPSTNGATYSPPPLGTGTLTLTISAIPGTPTLTWQAAGDGSPGAPVNITTSASYALVSSGGSILRVFASTELFPTTTSGSPYTASVTAALGSIYNTSSEPELSAIDRVHRRLNGGLSISSGNPHGMRGSDISTVLRSAQGIVVGDGAAISSLSNTSGVLVPRITTRYRGNGTVRELMYVDMSQSGYHRRTYLNVTTGTLPTASLITHNARWDGTNWNKDTTGNPATLWVQSNSTFFMYVQDNGTNTWADSGWLLSSSSTGGGTGALFFTPGVFSGQALITTANAAIGGTLSVTGSATVGGLTSTGSVSVTGNETVSGTITAASVIAPNTCKAWGKLTLQTGTNPAINDGFHFDNVTATSATVTVDITSAALASANYSVNITLNAPTTAFTGPTNGDTPCFIFVDAQATNSFGIRMANTLGGTGTLNDPTSSFFNGFIYYFQVFGH